MSDVGAGDAREQGAVLLDLGRPLEALGPLHRAVAEDPEDWYTYNLIAVAHLDLLDHAAALRAASAAVAIEPEREWSHRLRALALGPLGRTLEARDAAAEAVRLAPEVPEGLIVLAGALQAYGDKRGALAAAAHAVRLAPEHAGAARQLGSVLLAQKRWHDAELAFERALALDPESAVAHNNLALARLQLGRRTEAIEDLERSVRADPSLAEARDNIDKFGTRAWVETLAGVVYLVFGLGLFSGVMQMAAGALLTGAAVVAVSVLAILAAHRLVDVTRPLSAASAAMIDDRRRAQRRWYWSRATSFLPGRWVVFPGLHPWAGLVAVVAVLVWFTVAYLPLGLALTVLALPGSARRAWIHTRRRLDGRRSWRPPPAA